MYDDNGGKGDLIKNILVKGSVSKKHRMEKKDPSSVNMNKNIALKCIPDLWVEARAQSKECKHCGSKNHQWVICKILSKSPPTENRIGSLTWRLLLWKYSTRTKVFMN
jgi:hypothetical protein